MTDLFLHPQTDQDPTLELCPTCEHALTAHDRIGLRWCAATQLGVGQRDCVCSAATSAGASWAEIRNGSAAR
jgi:hypothetical protein